MTRTRYLRVFILIVTAAGFLPVHASTGKTNKDRNPAEQARKEALPSDMTVDKLLLKVKEAATKVESVSFSATVESDARDKSAGRKPNPDGLPDFADFAAEIKFTKPYLVQCRIVRGDSMPSLLKGALVTYRPDKDDGAIWMKPKGVPVAMKKRFGDQKGAKPRPLILNFIAFYADIAYLSRAGASAAIHGTAKVGGDDCYILRIHLGKKPGVPIIADEMEKGLGVPDPIKEAIVENVRDKFKAGTTRVDYFIRTGDFLPVQIDERSGESLRSRVALTNIAVD